VSGLSARLTSALVVSLLLAFAGCGHGSSSTPPRPPRPPPAFQLAQGQAIILVRVVQSTFPNATQPPDSPNGRSILGKVVVLKSLWGPFSAGRELYVGAVFVCNGPPGCCGSYPLKAGDELVIFTNDHEPIHAGVCTTWPAAESQALIAAVDQAVKEQLELEDPQTDLQRAPERHRVMQGLKKCFADASLDSKNGTAYPSCQAMGLSVLFGIKRSELAANWGPPTWCQEPTSPGPTYVEPTRADCPPEQAAIWTFGHPGSYLVCNGQKSLRCMGLGWITNPGLPEPSR
jgi:hypothetical protein